MQRFFIVKRKVSGFLTNANENEMETLVTNLNIPVSVRFMGRTEQWGFQNKIESHCFLQNLYKTNI